ncbi:hypothetical protein Droror1_Dr00022553 [Drosera rotundifolia]
MGRGVSCGGGQSSLGYLFGSGETNNGTRNTPHAIDGTNTPVKSAPMKPTDSSAPAGITGNLANNYIRSEGQNRGNFITDRPTTKVHAAPGGSSSLGYLFGGGNGN